MEELNGSQKEKAISSMLKSMIMSLCFLLLVAFCKSESSFASDPKPPLLQPYFDGDCLPVSEFRLGQVALGDREERVKKALGSPIRVERIEEEDDGGGYVLHRLHYKYLVIDIVRGKVDRLRSISPKISTPAGIHSGLTGEQIIKIYGRKSKNWDKGFDAVTCPEMKNGQEWNASYVMSLSFNEQKILLKIDMAANRP